MNHTISKRLTVLALTVYLIIMCSTGDFAKKTDVQKMPAPAQDLLVSFANIIHGFFVTVETNNTGNKEVYQYTLLSPTYKRMGVVQVKADASGIGVTMEHSGNWPFHLAIVEAVVKAAGETNKNISDFLYKEYTKKINKAMISQGLARPITLNIDGVRCVILLNPSIVEFAIFIPKIYLK